jgi:hypothetical protein
MRATVPDLPRASYWRGSVRQTRRSLAYAPVSFKANLPGTPEYKIRCIIVAYLCSTVICLADNESTVCSFQSFDVTTDAGDGQSFDVTGAISTSRNLTFLLELMHTRERRHKTRTDGITRSVMIQTPFLPHGDHEATKTISPWRRPTHPR